MSQSHAHTSVASLDLHGRRLEDAISQVTVFLERIRRDVAASSMGNAGVPPQHLFVTIITGAGSHSTHGPVLRNAVQKLFQKRGMTFKLERGGGAFLVDALSGWDLHDPGPPTESKVLLAEREDFHQMAFAQRGGNAGNFAEATMAMAQCAPPVPSSSQIRPVSAPRFSSTRPVSSLGPTGPLRRSSSNGFHRQNSNSEPLPSQVASEDADIRNATKLSSIELKQQQSLQNRMNNEYEREYHRAVSESELHYVRRQENKKEAEEEEESLLKAVLEQSVSEEQNRQKLTQEEFEDELMCAIEQSIEEDAKKKTPDENQYEEELRIALEQSTQQTCNTHASEDDLIQQALAASMAAMTNENASEDEEDLLEKALAESLLLKEDRRKKEAWEYNLPEQQQPKPLSATTAAMAGDQNTSDDEGDLLKKALAESSLLEEDTREKSALEYNLREESQTKPPAASMAAMAGDQDTSDDEDDLLEKALAESLLLEEDRRKREAWEYNLQEESQTKPPGGGGGVNILEEVIRRSLQERDNVEVAEEEAMEKAIKMSQQLH
mmetsp:Transcript_39620/g.83294  ORF Transcript_39620/g.83294 Transcript_39620/m.83294 type:complete len:551 (+) Transcript_39620:42-1694(+)